MLAELQFCRACYSVYAAGEGSAPQVCHCGAASWMLFAKDERRSESELFVDWVMRKPARISGFIRLVHAASREAKRRSAAWRS